MNGEHQSPIRTQALDATVSPEQRAFLEAHGVTFGEHLLILGPNPIIKNQHGGTIQIGEHTVLNSDPLVANGPLPNPVTLVAGIGATIRIGASCSLYGASITAYESVDIGDRVLIGPAGLICDTDLHPIDLEMRRRQIEGRPYPIDAVARRPVVIEDDAWLGYGVVVLKGVRIGRGAVVGAGAVVTRDVPAHCIAAGNPARVVRRLRDDADPANT